MRERQFRASLSRSQGRSSWCIIFRHPVRLGSDGRPGLRVRRGLGTSDETEAQRLVNQMNELIGNESSWSPAARVMAERKYDSRIVAAFYDNPTLTPYDSWNTRDMVIPLPGPEEEYIRVLLVGTTGAGKTTVVRQLICTDPTTERFPSTSASKTTVCDIEIILASGPFRAVVTFLPKDRVRHYIEECITSAVLAATENEGDEGLEVVAKRLLEHSDQRFRLSYLLGTFKNYSQSLEDDELTDEDESEMEMLEEQEMITDEDRAELERSLHGYVTRIQQLATVSQNRLMEDLGVSPEETQEMLDVLQELLREEALLEQEEFHQLVDDILDDVESRFTFIEVGSMERKRGGWPSHWTFETPNREEFIKTVNTFSSNHAPKFGRLLTPLVDGFRVSGPFRPDWWEGPAAPRLVLMDGEGLGHTADSASSLPTKITRRYQDVDVILLVDNAAQPMQVAPLAVLRSLVSSGHESKLVICFTHFDGVKGDNLRNTRAEKDHVLGSVYNAISTIGEALDRSMENALRRQTTDRVIFLSNIQKLLKPSDRLTRSEFNKLLTVIQDVAVPLAAQDYVPVYDDRNLVKDIVLSVQKALQEFHGPWRAKIGRGDWPRVDKEHWSRVKALSRRLGLWGVDEYDTLRPVADMIARLSECLNLFIGRPLRWEPREPSDDDISQAAIDSIARQVFSRLHELVSNRLFVEKVKDWIKAYSYSGRGSSFVRARDIEYIYDTAAPIPGETLTPDSDKFLTYIEHLVREAIREGGGKMVSGIS